MKKRITLLIVSLLFVVMLTACSSAQSSESGVAPAVSFDTTEEAVQRIKEVKAGGEDSLGHSGDFTLYNKEHLYILKECPIPGFEQSSIRLKSNGITIVYDGSASNVSACFFWHQGWKKEERLHIVKDQFNLKQYMDTKYYYGEYSGTIGIYWWENSNQFELNYPADTNIAPEDVIENIEVQRIDL